jgi:hypothetical protein
MRHLLMYSLISRGIHVASAYITHTRTLGTASVKIRQTSMKLLSSVLTAITYSAIEYDLESQHLSFSNLLSERMQLGYERTLKRLDTRRYDLVVDQN